MKIRYRFAVSGDSPVLTSPIHNILLINKVSTLRFLYLIFYKIEEEIIFSGVRISVYSGSSSYLIQSRFALGIKTALWEPEDKAERALPNPPSVLFVPEAGRPTLTT